VTDEKLLVAVGEVEAGVALDELQEDRMPHHPHVLMVDLPEARILESSLNEGLTRDIAKPPCLRLVERVLENYDRMPDEVQAELPLKRIWTLVPEE
jgi:hypothetical protein